MWFIPLILAAVQAGSSIYKANQEKKAEDAQAVQDRQTNFSNAIKRNINYSGGLRNPDPIGKPNTTTADTIGGVAQAAQSFKWGGGSSDGGIGSGGSSDGGIGSGAYSAD